MKENSFKPSVYQTAIFDFVENQIGSGVVQAVAGSGKTTTIVKALELIPSYYSILFLAFNKAIAEELKTRVPEYVQARTFHSVCFAAWSSCVGGKIQVDANKSLKILRNLVGEADCALYGQFVSKLVGLAKNAGLGLIVPNIDASWYELIAHFDLSLESEDANEQTAVKIAQELLKVSIEQGNRIVDFDDMIYLPLINNVHLQQNDVVFVDEAQDINQVQLAILKRLVKPGGRLIAVGDSCQAIYGFRGADSEAIKRITDAFSCTELPLTVSYRCPQEVVKFAQAYVPHIQAHENAPVGSVQTLDRYSPADFSARSAVICRNVAPLVSFAYSLLRRRVPCKVLGREIGAALSSLVKKQKAKNIETLIERLEIWKEREVARHVARGANAQAEAVNDKFDCLSFFIDELPENDRSIARLLKNIDELFSDKNVGSVTLCTAHKSKGLEWDVVNILDFRKYMPSKWARQAWQQQQEKNLIYVACTRAKQTLRFIESAKWTDAAA